MFLRASIAGWLVLAFVGCSSPSSPPGDDAGGDADSDADTDADSDADVVDPNCPDPPGDVSLQWLFDGRYYVDYPEDYDISCTIESVTEEEVGHSVVTLSCEREAEVETHTIDVTASPAPRLDVLTTSSDVMLRRSATPNDWSDEFFTLRSSSGDLLMAGVNGDSVAPVAIGPEDWYAPVGVSVISGLCMTRSTSCGSLERQGLEVTFGGETSSILSGTSDTVGTTQSILVIVSRARQYHSLHMECGDNPHEAYTALFVLDGGG